MSGEDSPVEIITRCQEFQSLCHGWRKQGVRTALVPTMGYFHDGHIALMRWARSQADKVIVSLFVNPTQFAPTEDLSRYPRDLERDEASARSAGVDLLFIPPAEEMYSPDYATWVTLPTLSAKLCGKTRPNHFQGVATVVTKLFQLALPEIAVFGQKDWQQLVIVKRLTQDLHIPVIIQGRPIVRETDGLAMSSRNVYLSETERGQAHQIYQGLLRTAQEAQKGQRQGAGLTDFFCTWLKTNAPLSRVDYAELVNPETLDPVEIFTGRALLVVAVFFGRTRLIDNMIIEV